MSKQLEQFINQQFNNWVTSDKLEEASNLFELKQSFKAELITIVNDFYETELDLESSLATCLAQNDAIGDAKWLKSRLAYYEENEGDESEEERTTQINGLNILINEC